jgi:hypothetical protein
MKLHRAADSLRSLPDLSIRNCLSAPEAGEPQPRSVRLNRSMVRAQACLADFSS